MSSYTLVTAFFDLKKRENSSRRSKDYYFEKAEYLFRQNHNFIFFTEPEYVEDIKRHREKHNLLEKTHIIGIEYEQLPYIKKYLSATVENFKNFPVHNFQPGKETPLYILLTWSKFTLLQQAIELNPFSSSHFAWIDFGLSHIAKTNETILDNIINEYEDKVKIMCMKHLCKSELTDMNLYYSWIWGKIAAGLITGSKNNMLTLINFFNKKVEHVIQLNRAILEEQILPLIYLENTELFNLYYGDYDHILLNYCQTTGNFDVIITNIIWCRQRGENALAYDVCKNLLSVKTKLSHTQRLTLYHESFIVAWYTCQSDCLKILGDLQQSCLEDPDFKNHYLNNYENLKSNFTHAFSLVNKPKIGCINGIFDLKLIETNYVIIFTDEKNYLNFPPANPCYKHISELSNFPNMKVINSASFHL